MNYDYELQKKNAINQYKNILKLSEKSLKRIVDTNIEIKIIKDIWVKCQVGDCSIEIGIWDSFVQYYCLINHIEYSILSKEIL